MPTILKTSKVQLSITLLFIFISAFFYKHSMQPLFSLGIIILTTISFDFIFLKLRKKPLFFPSAAIVSGLIITLLTAPNLPLYDYTLASIIAMFTKNFVRIQGRHIFNPAAIGLFLTALIFQHNVSWWAVSFQQFSISHFPSLIYFLILLSPAFVSIYRMKRYRIIFSFLVAYIFINFILNSKFLILDSLLDPTVLFFALVMLPEPMTTPNNHLRQLLFGSLVALLSILVSFPSSIFPASPAGGHLPFSIAIPDPLIFALLLGNALFFRFR